MSMTGGIIADLLLQAASDEAWNQAIFEENRLQMNSVESIKRILTDKGFQNRDRYNQLRDLVGSLLAKAKLLVAGADVEVSSEDPEARIIRGFHELIGRAYPNLRMLRGITVTETDVGNYLSHSTDGLFGGDATNLAESEQELLSFIQSNSRGGVRTTLKGLIEKFERKPYGWYYAAILCNLANLCARGKLEVRADGNLLEDDELERALLNTHGYTNVVLEPTLEFTASQVRRLKEFFEDFFDAPPTSGEAKALGKETNAKVQELMTELDRLFVQADRYSFLNGLEPVIEKQVVRTVCVVMLKVQTNTTWMQGRRHDVVL